MIITSKSISCKILSLAQTFIYLFTIIFLPIQSFAQSTPLLPVTAINATYNPVLIQGMKIHPENPFQLDFIIDPGDAHLEEAKLKEESTELIKYFLTSLTVSEKNLWVNLSPYEKDRIIGKELQSTEMGKELLELDLQLKQLASSILNPNQKTGQEFWKRVQEKIHDQFGDAEIPLNFHNKVWIVPGKAVLNIKNDQVIITESYLKVLHESDYLSIENSLGNIPEQMDTNSVSQQILKEVIIPELEKEVNTSETFAKLRQIYHSSILAAWYKKNLKESLLNKVYSDQNKTKSIEAADQNYPQTVYGEYLKAFKLGVFDFVKEEYDPKSQQVLPKKYFSGGISATDLTKDLNVKAGNPSMLSDVYERAKNWVVAGAVLLSICGAGGCGDNDNSGEFSTPTPTVSATPKPGKDVIFSTDTFAKLPVNPEGIRSLNRNGKSYVAFAFEDIKFFDINDPSKPASTIVVPDPSGIENFIVQGDNLLVATRKGVWIYSLDKDLNTTDPRHPTFVDLTDIKTVQPFIDFIKASFPNLNFRDLREDFLSSFRAVLLPDGGFLVINNAMLRTNAGAPVLPLAFYAVFYSDGSFSNVMAELAHQFPGQNFQDITLKDNITYLVSPSLIVKQVTGSMAQFGRVEVLPYPNGPISQIQFDPTTGEFFTSEEAPETRNTDTRIHTIITPDGNVVSIEQHKIPGPRTASILVVDKTGKTFRVFPVSSADDPSRSLIENFSTAKIDNGDRVVSNHEGAVAITDVIDGKSPQVRAVIRFNPEGVNNPDTQADKTRLVSSVSLDQPNDTLYIRTQDGTLYTVSLSKFLSLYESQTVYIEDILDSAMASNNRFKITDVRGHIREVIIEKGRFYDARTRGEITPQRRTRGYVDEKGETIPFDDKRLKDKAMAAPGGIDLNSANLELTIQGETIKFAIPDEFKNLNPVEVQGIKPVITNLTPYLPLQPAVKY